MCVVHAFSLMSVSLTPVVFNGMESRWYMAGNHREGSHGQDLRALKLHPNSGGRGWGLVEVEGQGLFGWTMSTSWSQGSTGETTWDD